VAKSGPFLGIGIAKNFYEFASGALQIAIFENFIKSMTSRLSKLHTPRHCFANKTKSLTT
jgi:hypothetical protein